MTTATVKRLRRQDLPAILSILCFLLAPWFCIGSSVTCYTGAFSEA